MYISFLLPLPLYKQIIMNRLIKVSKDIPALSEFKVRLSSIINPEDSQCRITKTIISILSSDKTLVNSKSTVSSSNQAEVRSTYSSSFRYMNWYVDAVQIKFNRQVVNLKAGSFSKLISIKDPISPFSKMITYKLLPLDNAEFSLISDLVHTPSLLK